MDDLDCLTAKKNLQGMLHHAFHANAHGLIKIDCLHETTYSYWYRLYRAYMEIPYKDIYGGKNMQRK